jgi:hypothetical protein
MALRLIQYCLEYCDKNKIREIGGGKRGIYVLYYKDPDSKTKQFEVRYIGMTDSGIRGRLRRHRASKRKNKYWTHFSAYAVWPNITKEEIVELEGLFRHFYRYDRQANILNLQRKYKGLKGITADNPKQWREKTDFSKIIGNT